jgi:outer membrane scaffolding protein for murein synthesis (MipA/OmpV family)
MPRRCPSATAALLPSLLLLFALPAARGEETLPLWELGAGVGALTLPDYPGSDQSDNIVIPVPYVIYRGEFFQADRDGMRARFVDDSRFEIDLSLGATPPVYSGESDARGGMPDLSPSLEIGPEFRFHIARDGGDERTRAWEWNFSIPVRHALTILDGHAHSVGNVAYPHLNWKQRFHGWGDAWEIDADLGAYFNDGSYHRYFYEVAPRYATPARPAYEPRAGYGGWEGSVYSSHSFGRWRALGFVEFGSIGGARFEQSPLVRRMTSVTAGLAVTWVFWTSQGSVANR